MSKNQSLSTRGAAAAALMAQIERGDADPLNQVRLEAMASILPLLLDCDGFAIALVRHYEGGTDGLTVIGGEMPKIDTVKRMLEHTAKIGNALGITVNVRHDYCGAGDSQFH